MARSGLIFDPQTGLYAPDTAELREGVAQDWQDAFFEPDSPVLDTDPTTAAGQLVDLQVAEIEAKNSELLYISNQFNPYINDGRWQDALAKIYFLERKRGEPTIATCTVTGLYGTTIPYGALVRNTDGYTLVCNRAVTIGNNGKAETTFRVVEYGAIEIPANSVTQIVTVIPGRDTVNNEAAGVLGRVAETRSEFELRRRQSVFNCSHGTVGALHSAIAALEGVLDCVVLENIDDTAITKNGVQVPAHGVTICVYGGKDGDIAKAIYERKDAGCSTGGNTTISYSDAQYARATYNYRILRPRVVNFHIRVTFGRNANITAGQTERLKKALYADFHGQGTNPRIGLAQTVYASRFYCPINDVEFASYIQRIEIRLDNGQFGDMVEIMANQEPVLAMSNILVEGA